MGDPIPLTRLDLAFLNQLVELLLELKLEMLDLFVVGRVGMASRLWDRYWKETACQRVIEAMSLAVLHAGQEAPTRSGCLPENYQACEMMRLVFSLRRAVLDCSSFIGKDLD
jgi:hypothetical protein